MSPINFASRFAKNGKFGKYELTCVKVKSSVKIMLISVNYCYNLTTVLLLLQDRSEQP